jgi:hypothetical protein
MGDLPLQTSSTSVDSRVCWNEDLFAFFLLQEKDHLRGVAVIGFGLSNRSQ